MGRCVCVSVSSGKQQVFMLFSLLNPHSAISCRPTDFPSRTERFSVHLCAFVLTMWWMVLAHRTAVWQNASNFLIRITIAFVSLHCHFCFSWRYCCCCCMSVRRIVCSTRKTFLGESVSSSVYIVCLAGGISQFRRLLWIYCFTSFEIQTAFSCRTPHSPFVCAHIHTAPTRERKREKSNENRTKKMEIVGNAKRSATAANRRWELFSSNFFEICNCFAIWLFGWRASVLLCRRKMPWHVLHISSSSPRSCSHGMQSVSFFALNLSSTRKYFLAAEL